MIRSTEIESRSSNMQLKTMNVGFFCMIPYVVRWSADRQMKFEKRSSSSYGWWWNIDGVRSSSTHDWRETLEVALRSRSYASLMKGGTDIRPYMDDKMITGR